MAKHTAEQPGNIFEIASEPITHTKLGLGMEATRMFFADHDTRVGATIVNEVLSVNRALKDIEGHSGTFGLGYPFYALDTESGIVVSVPAIDEFISESEQKIETNREAIGEAWPCIDCQRTNQLPNLKTMCKPCDKTVFKPRDLFKVLPDIDMVTVFDGRSAELEEMVQSRLADRGLLQSDTDIAGSYKDALLAMQGEGDGKLPVDVHIWPREDFEACCEQIIANPADTTTQILSRSLHAKWEDNPINFWFDFVFSLTEIAKVNSSLQEVIDETRAKLVGKLGVTGVMDLVPQASRRAGIILKDDTLKQLLQRRLESWG